MKELYLIVKRKTDGYEAIYSADDIVKAISAQKALIGNDELTSDIVREARKTVTDDEVREVSANIEKANYDRLYNDDEEVYIFHMPARD